MGPAGVPVALRAYVALLFAALVAILVGTIMSGDAFDGHIAAWLALVAMVSLLEYTDLSFHQGESRVGLSASETVLMPLLMGFSFNQVVWGATAGLAIVQILRHRDEPIKVVYNVAQYGCSTAVAAWTWRGLHESGEIFTIRNAGAGVVAVLVFVILTHLMTLQLVSTLQKKPIYRLGNVVAPAALWNLAGNLVLGLFFASSLSAGYWTVAFYPLPLAALYIGYRAVLRQSRERERIESLHSASRALAASPDLGNALTGFLASVAEIALAREACVLIKMKDEVLHSSVREGTTTASLEVVTESPLLSLLERFESDPSAVIVGLDQIGPLKDVAIELGGTMLLSVPLSDHGKVIGLIAALDKEGAEEFGTSDARLFEALSDELVLTLDSYRLFLEVSEERERFQRIFTGSKEGICLLDEEGRVRAWNPALERITGFADHEMVGKVWSDRVLVRDREHQRIESLQILDVSPDVELEIVTRSGPSRWVALVSGPVQTGQEKGWVVLVRDVTAEHAAEQAKGDFLATISHELRTPLTTIKGSLQVLSRPKSDPYSEIGQQMVSIMRRGTDRLERLLMNLLVVSQMETGEVQVFLDEVSIQDALSNRIAIMLEDHPQVEVSAPEQTLIVRADRERLFQVIDHLLDNAHKFGGAENPIKIEVKLEDGYALLSVKDQGPGIAEADQGRIFDRFTRLGHLLTRETQGAGVGLFIAKRSVEAMEGTIWVESKPGAGATFYARLPLAHPMMSVADSAS